MEHSPSTACLRLLEGCHESYRSLLPPTLLRLLQHTDLQVGDRPLPGRGRRHGATARRQAAARARAEPAGLHPTRGQGLRNKNEGEMCSCNLIRRTTRTYLGEEA